MGKNLKGKECGKGICQRKDGLYLARFVDKTGKRHDKCFRKLPEARNWLEEVRVHDRQGEQCAEPSEGYATAPDMTVNEWFEFWIENIVGDLAPNTLRNYRDGERDRLKRSPVTVQSRSRTEHMISSWQFTHPGNFGNNPPLLNQTLTYVDRRTGQNSTLVMTDLVFINFRTGEPSKNSSYDTHLYKICDENGNKRFCMHALRHTYATRAIESGMQPKVLQKLLGHASIQTTMDKYVHVTDDSLAAGVRQFESSRT